MHGHGTTEEGSGAAQQDSNTSEDREYSNMKRREQGETSNTTLLRDDKYGMSTV